MITYWWQLGLATLAGAEGLKLLTDVAERKRWRRTANVFGTLLVLTIEVPPGTVRCRRNCGTKRFNSLPEPEDAEPKGGQGESNPSASPPVEHIVFDLAETVSSHRIASTPKQIGRHCSRCAIANFRRTS